jgi:hypothetical protein
MHRVQFASILVSFANVHLEYTENRLESLEADHRRCLDESSTAFMLC